MQSSHFRVLLISSLLAVVSAQEGWTTGTILSYAAIFQTLGCAFFGSFGIRSDRDFFLLLGNVCCVAGCVVWILMLHDEDGSPTWMTWFACLACFNSYATYIVFDNYRKFGCTSDSESDGDDVGFPMCFADNSYRLCGSLLPQVIPHTPCQPCKTKTAHRRVESREAESRNGHEQFPMQLHVTLAYSWRHFM